MPDAKVISQTLKMFQFPHSHSDLRDGVQTYKNIKRKRKAAEATPKWQLLNTYRLRALVIQPEITHLQTLHCL